MSDAYLSQQDEKALIKQWWQRIGQHVLTAFLLVVVIYFSWNRWQTHQEQQREQASAQYQSLLAADEHSDTQQALNMAAQLKSEHPSSPYAIFASIYIGRQLVHQKQVKEANREFHWAISHTKDPLLQQLLQLELAIAAIAQQHYSDALSALAKIKLPQLQGISAMTRGEAYRLMGQSQQAHEQFKQAEQSLSSHGQSHPLATFELALGTPSSKQQKTTR